jgi:DNA-binding transcriptional LysR family regulator
MLDIRQIQSFLAVAQAGSFVSAADTLGLSKAAVSRHISDLEAQVGARLLHRTTRRLSLTDEGQRFQQRASELLGAWEELEAETANSGAEAIGVLRVNAPLSFGILHLAPLWGRFLEQNPKLTLQLDLSDRLVDLVDEGYDLAVRIMRLGNSQLVSRQLTTTRMVLCASPDYLARNGNPIHPRDLNAHRAIAYTLWSGGDDWSFDGPDGETRVRVQPCIHTNSGDTCRAAALQGQGIVLQPDFLVGPDLQQGRLVELLPGFRSMTLGVHAVYATRKHLPLKTRRLIDFLVASFRAPPWRHEH